MKRKVGAIGIILGLLIVVAAAFVRWVAAPSLAVLPSNTDTTRVYTGTAATLLNPAAIATGGQVMLNNVPITVRHHTNVLKTKGSNALVSDAKTIVASGRSVAAVDYRYAVNRSQMSHGTGFSGVVDQTGLTFNWPIHTRMHDYVGWVSDTHQTVPLHFTGTATRGGIKTYVFTARTAQAQIVDPQVLKSLPASMPKAVVTKLIAGLGLPAAQTAAFTQALPLLPDPIKFAYAYQVNATYWVAPASGMVVDLKQHEVRSIGVAIGPLAPIAKVMDITFTSPPATLAAAVADARDSAHKLTLIYTTVPWALTMGGGLVVLIGLALILQPVRKIQTPPTAPPIESIPREPAHIG